ncbi:MAG: 4-alpha-glucanotransferase [Cyanobacteria bacterium J06635_10]
MSFERASGVLLHPTSLPSKFGIGDLGESAYKFVDFLVSSGQKLWQILPLGPTGYEHSPYTMNFSAFAGNPLMISLEIMLEEGLLTHGELIPLEKTESNLQRVDFDAVIPYKTKILQQAYQRFQKSLAETANREFENFCKEQASWLDDYVLFMALLEANDYKAWNFWDPAVARREQNALEAQRDKLKDAISYHKFLQYKFFQQWKKIRTYANDRNIKIVGDISIYVCHNSADVWANPEIFQLDSQTLESAYIAGVPPDYFSATGQLWGNPVYDWDKLEETNFSWWIERFRATLEYVDIVRIDHFRGFEAYWRVPAGEETAINGEWVKGPDKKFFETLGSTLGSLPVMAEDLGIITPEVEELRDTFNFPGMRILQFAFGGEADNPYLPHNYIQNCVVYPGTHDNDTSIGWWKGAGKEEKQHVAKYLGYSSPEEVKEINWEFIRMALSSVGDLAILSVQDFLDLGSDGRMNDPSVSAGNWRWRYQSDEQLTPELSRRLLEMTRLYKR